MEGMNRAADSSTEAADESRTASSVLAKAALVLETVAHAGVIGASELSRVSGLPKTTAYRVATELCAVGLLDRAGDGFRLAAKLFELGSRVPGRRHLRDAALPYLEDLSRASGQTIHLAVLDGEDVLYVERLVGARSSEVPSSVAARLPLHCTATGKCLLAFGPNEIATRVLQAPLEPRTSRSISDAAALRHALQAVRDQGFAVEIGEVETDLCSIAAPVWGFGGELVGAISATGPIDGFDMGTCEGLVRLATDSLSRRLGGA